MRKTFFVKNDTACKVHNSKKDYRDDQQDAVTINLHFFHAVYASFAAAFLAESFLKYAFTGSA